MERSSITRLGKFITQMTRLVSRDDYSEQAVLEIGPNYLADLISTDTWLHEPYTEPHPRYYSQYLLYCDPFERFSIVSFVWGPNQKTPIHNHTVWGLIGMLRGGELARRYRLGRPMVEVSADRLSPGMVDVVSPQVGDIHEVSNAFDDRPSVSIHVYGANIGNVSRQVFDPTTGTATNFVSGYLNRNLPNPWAGVTL